MASKDYKSRPATQAHYAARSGGGLDGVDAQLVGDALQKFDVSVNHEARSLGNRLRKPRMKMAKPGHLLWVALIFC
jgi:hypothetical protein